MTFLVDLLGTRSAYIRKAVMWVLMSVGFSSGYREGGLKFTSDPYKAVENDEKRVLILFFKVKK